MLRYLWPGNIRELKSVVQGAIASTSRDVELTDFPATYEARDTATADAAGTGSGGCHSRSDASLSGTKGASG